MTERTIYIVAGLAAAIYVSFIPGSMPILARWALVGAGAGMLIFTRTWRR